MNPHHERAATIADFLRPDAVSILQDVGGATFVLQVSTTVINPKHLTFYQDVREMSTNMGGRLVGGFAAFVIPSSSSFLLRPEFFIVTKEGKWIAPSYEPEPITIVFPRSYWVRLYLTTLGDNPETDIIMRTTYHGQSATDFFKKVKDFQASGQQTLEDLNNVLEQIHYANPYSGRTDIRRVLDFNDSSSPVPVFRRRSQMEELLTPVCLEKKKLCELAKYKRQCLGSTRPDPQLNSSDVGVQENTPSPNPRRKLRF